jgi:hypothetical protein
VANLGKQGKMPGSDDNVATRHFTIIRGAGGCSDRQQVRDHRQERFHRSASIQPSSTRLQGDGDQLATWWGRGDEVELVAPPYQPVNQRPKGRSPV